MRKVLFTLSAVLFVCFNSMAQRDSLKQTKFGFNFGLNYSGLQMQKDLSYSINSIDKYSGFGFKMGLLAEHLLNLRFSFVPKAEISFNETGLRMVNLYKEEQIITVYPITLELASHFSFALSDNKLKPYLLFGPSVKIPVTHNSDLMHAPVDQNSYCVDLGFGLDKTLKYFNFSPEIHYSYGINNISNIEGIKKLHYHCVSIILNIKG